MTKNLLALIFALISMSSCVSNRSDDLNVPGSELSSGELQISTQAMEEIIQNISSPIEMASLIKELGVPFSARYLSNVSEENRYASPFKMALSLGILGADLGYLNVYEKTGSSLNYLSGISRLSDGLKINQFFDFNTLKRLAASSTSLDSLVFLSVHSFNNMDDHLRKTERSNLSALMVAGVWIEGMYLVTQVAKEKPNETLAGYIGEQKSILNDLLIILKNYESDDQFSQLIADLEKIKSEFADVKITYEMGEPMAVEKDGMLMIVQQEKSNIEISENTLNKIISVTEDVRNRLLTI
jgi:hypothetical protein